MIRRYLSLYWLWLSALPAGYALCLAEYDAAPVFRYVWRGWTLLLAPVVMPAMALSVAPVMAWRDFRAERAAS